MILSIALFAALAYVASEHARPLIYDYRFGPDAFAVVLLGRWRIHVVPFRDILEVRALPIGELLALSVSIGRANFWVNRLFVRHVAIASSGRLLLIVSPRDSAKFCVELRRRCSEAGTGE